MMDNSTKKLCSNEIFRLAERMDIIEVDEYRSGLNRISGSFAICSLIDYDDDKIILELRSGVQSDCENRVYVTPITLDRHTMKVQKED